MRTFGQPGDPEVVRALQNQLEDLRKRCKKGQATPEVCAKIIELEASVESVSTGAPVEDVLAKKKASRFLQTALLVGGGLYLAAIAARFFRR